MRSLTGPAFRFLMRLQGIGDPAAVSRAELDAYLALIKGPDRGRAFLRIMRRAERTPAKQARNRAAVRDVPYPVQAIWAAGDPAMTLAGYGERARAAAGLDARTPSQASTSPGRPGARHRQADRRIRVVPAGPVTITTIGSGAILWGAVTFGGSIRPIRFCRRQGLSDCHGAGTSAGRCRPHAVRHP
jgi:hypothetical protein